MANIDSLRFFASFAIVLSHSSEFLVPRYYRPVNHIQTAGLTTFVDVFFILSGFIISFVYAGRTSGPMAFARFLQKRFARLYPLYFVTFVIMIAIYAAIAWTGIHANTTASLTPACLGGGLMLVHAWFDCGGIPPQGVSWSISAELFAYLLFPIGLITLKMGRIARLAMFAILLFACARPFGGLAELSLSFSALRAIPPFYFGMLVYAEREDIARLRLPRKLWMALVGVMAVSSLLILPRALILGLAYVTALAAIGRDLAADGRQSVQEQRSLRIPAAMGQLTYSIYMVHPIVTLVFLNAICDKYLDLSWPTMIVATILTWCLIMIVSFLSFEYFENPARRWINKFKLGGVS